MTKPTREGHFRLLMRQDNTMAGRAVMLGPYTYTPASAYSSATANGTLSKGGSPVPLEETESLLQDFLDNMNRLEDDLARRWVGSEPRPGFSQAG